MSHWLQRNFEATFIIMGFCVLLVPQCAQTTICSPINICPNSLNWVLENPNPGVKRWNHELEPHKEVAVGFSDISGECMWLCHLSWLCRAYLASKTPNCSFEGKDGGHQPSVLTELQHLKSQCFATSDALGGFSNRRVFHFWGKVRIVSRTLSGLFLVGAVDRQRKRKMTNRENPTGQN